MEPETGTRSRPANRLANETSPYLLQHAHNPVDWFPWGPEALERAAAEDKPILLSVGYAACHWCHVMERESFEDENTAALMNQLFVPIKVDREERPDIDAIYMDAVQSMTGSGGWPMTVFLTPSGEPFFAGTYFPKEDGHGMPAFSRVLTGVAEAWRERRTETVEHAGKVIEAIRQNAPADAGKDPDDPDDETLQQAFTALSQGFDRQWGGWGGAPKFPQAMTIEFLLRFHANEDGEDGDAALDMAKRTLDKMAAGGIFDQVGGGFHRYSTDGAWHVPHFEKMLYDNALLARVYARAFLVTGDDRYRTVATRTLDYLLREMRHPGGGFFSSQDADTEGVEGKFFVWSWDELVEVAGEQVAGHFGATTSGNWEETNVLWEPLKPDPAETSPIEEARARLFERREARVHPAIDDKILAAWNGLAISALADAGRIFGEERFVRAAVDAAEFVLQELRRQDGRLLRSWRDGRAGGPGYCEDYALVGSALLSLHEASLDMRFFEEARKLGDELIELFFDGEGRGAFFQTGSDAEKLVIRPREFVDNAVPSGNSAAAEMLSRLAAMTGAERYARTSSQALRAVAPAMAQFPTGFGHALSALDFQVNPGKEIAIVGDPAAADTRALAREVWSRFLPNSVMAVATDEDASAAKDFALLEGRTMQGGAATAYVCEHFVCKRPVTQPHDLAGLLS